MYKKRIFIAGHRGMVGSALLRFLKDKDNEIIIKNKLELDLLNQSEVKNFFKNYKIDQVYLAAAKVGGIHSNNNFPAEFIPRPSTEPATCVPCPLGSAQFLAPAPKAYPF